MNRKTITGAAAAVIVATVLITRERPIELAPIPSEPPPVFEPLTVWVCCSVLGCTEVTGPAQCPASDDLVSCCAPSTEPDGSVGCGC